MNSSGYLTVVPLHCRVILLGDRHVSLGTISPHFGHVLEHLLQLHYHLYIKPCITPLPFDAPQCFICYRVSIHTMVVVYAFQHDIGGVRSIQSYQIMSTSHPAQHLHFVWQIAFRKLMHTRNPPRRNMPFSHLGLTHTTSLLLLCNDW